MPSHENESVNVASLHRRVERLLELEAAGEGSQTPVEQERADLHIALLRQWLDRTSLADLASHIAAWRQQKGFRTDWLNVPEKLMLIVTELSEAMEAYRHIEPAVLAARQNSCDGMGGARDGYFCWEDVPQDVKAKNEPYIKNFEEELADAFVRLADLAGSLWIDLHLQVAQKMATNELRPHKHGKER